MREEERKPEDATTNEGEDRDETDNADASPEEVSEESFPASDPPAW